MHVYYLQIEHNPFIMYACSWNEKIDNYLTATLTKQWSSRPEGVYFAMKTE